MRDGARRGIYWRPDAAAHALGFLPAVLAVTDGPSAGQPFHPLAWHTFVVGSIFGWRTATDRLRFRSAWLETGKGQAKSPLMAAIGLYIMGWFEIPRAQVYALGNDKATANVLFRDAAAMCRADIPDQDEGDSLETRGEVMVRGEGDNAYKIEHPETGSFFKTLAGGERQSGPRPAAVLADEIHEFRTDIALKIWEEAIAKVATSAIMILGTNTPATTQHVGTAVQRPLSGHRGRQGEGRHGVLVRGADRQGRSRHRLPPTRHAGPRRCRRLGETFPIENIRERVNTARTRISTASSVKRLYFGVDVGAADFWIEENRVGRRCKARSRTEVDLKANCAAKRCYLALDLSRKNDLTALSGDWVNARRPTSPSATR